MYTIQVMEREDLNLPVGWVEVGENDVNDKKFDVILEDIYKKTGCGAFDYGGCWEQKFVKLDSKGKIVDWLMVTDNGGQYKVGAVWGIWIPNEDPESLMNLTCIWVIQDLYPCMQADMVKGKFARTVSGT